MKLHKEVEEALSKLENSSAEHREFAKKIKSLNMTQTTMIAKIVVPLSTEKYESAAAGIGDILTFIISDLNDIKARIKKLENINNK